MDFISILSIFVLACFVGYYVVWSVTPALHTPLMAVTNAISSVIIVGALIAAAAAGSAWLEMARPARRGAGQRQHLRRLRRHRADAGNVQEEGQPAASGRWTTSDQAHAVPPAWVAAGLSGRGRVFILALRGLSSPATSRAGNRFGMIGMAIAVVTTLVTHFPMQTAITAPDAMAVTIDGTTALRSSSPSPSARSSASIDRAAHRDDRDAATGRRVSHAWSAWRQCWSLARPISTRAPSASLDAGRS